MFFFGKIKSAKINLNTAAEFHKRGLAASFQATTSTRFATSFHR